MKKIISISVAAVLLASCSNSNDQLKGSDLVSMHDGAKYTYLFTSSFQGSNPFSGKQVLTIKDCNKDATECTQVLSMDDGQGFASKYSIKDGAVYSNVMTAGGEQKLLFAADIKVGKKEPIHNKNSMMEYDGQSTYTKVIPTMTVGDNTYQNCVELKSSGLNKFKSGQTESSESTEVYCKGVGLVKNSFTFTDAASGKLLQKASAELVKIDL